MTQLTSLGKLFFREEANGAWTPIDRTRLSRVKCPDCGSRYYTKLGSVMSAENGGAWVETLVGALCSCQKCPCVYVATDTGTFKRHYRSLPPILQMPENKSEKVNPRSDEDDEEYDDDKPNAEPLRDALPVAKERPRIP